jgi:hypothetical protein
MENENVNQDYLTGFNQGYLLAKHTPELVGKLAAMPTSTQRLEGMKEGIEQYVLEQSKDKTPDWLKKDRLTKGKQQDKNLDRD